MKKTRIIKTLTKGGISLLLIAGTTSALAADNSPALLKNIAAINYASEITALQQQYQNDINASAIQQTNKEISTISTASNTNTQQLNQLQTQRLLQSFQDLIVPKPNTSNAYSYASDSNPNNGIKSSLKIKLLSPFLFSTAINSDAYKNMMTTLLAASDSAYLPTTDFTNTNTQEEAIASRRSNDAYFNANSLFGPTTYTPAQHISAILYENYLINPSHLYQQMTGQAQQSFTDFKHKLKTLTRDNSTTDDHTKAKAMITALQADPSYKKFKFLERSALSSYSLSQNTLNSILTERSVPLDSSGVAIASKITNSDGKVVTEKVSPLELESHRASYRLSSKFQNSMQAASSATVQRQMLSTLAEIEQQLFQQHLDHEKEIALLAKININETDQTIGTSMITLQQDLKTAVSSSMKN